MELKLDFGFKTYEIKDVDGNTVGAIRFNPNDPGIAVRWKEASEKIAALRDQAAALMDKPQEEAVVQLFEQGDKAIKDMIDYALGTKASDVLFGGASAFALCEADGAMLLEHVLDALRPVLEQSMQKAAETTAARMQQHTAAYQGTDKGLAPGQAAGK